MANKTISIGFKIEEGEGGFKKLTMDAETFRKIMHSTVKEVESVKKSMFDFASFSVGIQNASAALSRFKDQLGALTADSKSFSDAMRSTNTMAGKGAEDFDRLKDSVSDLSRRVPVARDALAKGLYQVISNGVPEKNWITFLESSARSSIGGIADLGQAVGVTSTLIKNYGLSWDSAASIQDKIQLTTKNGVTSFEQLAAALPRVAGNAATLGVSIDDLMAAFATLTGVSGNTAEVSTQIAAIFTALVKPSSEAGKMAEEMGIKFDAAAIKAAGGFSAFLSQLDEAVKSYAQSSGVLEQEVYGRLFGSAESLRALIPLTGELSSKFKENISAMSDSAGTMNEAFDSMAKTSTAKTQAMQNSISFFQDFASAVIAPIKPLLNMGGVVLQTAANVGILAMSFKTLSASLMIPAFNGMMNVFVKMTPFIRKASVSLTMFATSAGASSKAAVALGMSLHALTAAGIVGAVIGLSFVIKKLAGAHDEAADKTRQAEQQERSLSEARASAAAKLSEQTTRLNTLIAAAKNEKLGLKDRRKAIDELNRIIPDYNAKLDETAGKYSANAAAVQKYIDTLKRQYEIEGAQEQIKKAASEKAKALIEIQRQETKLSELRKKQQSATAAAASPRPGGGTVQGADSRLAVTSFNAEISGVSSNIAKLKKTIADQDELIKAIDSVYGSGIQEATIRSIEPPKTTDSESGSGSGSGRAKSAEPMAPEGSIADLKNRIGDIDKKISFSIDPEQIAELTLQKQALEKQIGDMEVAARIIVERPKMQGVEEELKRRPLELDVKVNTEGLKDGLKDIPEEFKDINKDSKQLGKNLSGLGDICRSAGDAFSSMGNAFESPELNIAGTISQAIANILLSFGQAMTKDMSPWEWAAFGLGGLAQVTAMIAQVKSIGKFADGGIAYGPTLGLFGEYAGARSNPEVVAPLDKLRGMLEPAQAAPVIIGGDVRLRGSDLVIALRNETRVAAASGHRSGIR